MPLIKFPQDTKIDFIGIRWIAFILSSSLILLTIVLLLTRGLNFGIDFTGGILMDAKFEQAADIGKMRGLLNEANFGDVSLQTFGSPNDILIRIGQGSAQENDRVAIVAKVKEILSANFQGNIDYRKVDYVGPKVGSELIKSGGLALFLSIVAIMVYVWFRFEWQYGLGAIAALMHDAFLTLGFFSLTQLEFNLSSLAAVLTIIGYSINDTVVIFDRIRDNVRKYKKMPMADLLNVSINDNLTRTILTSFTTLMALFALVLVGGSVVQSFSLSALFGIAIGTYSSIYIASPLLIYFDIRDIGSIQASKEATAEKPANT